MKNILTSLKAIFLISILAVCASAATITVTNTNDSGAGSLRQAIADAASGDTINFGVTGTITLTTSQLVIDKSLTIQGPGADLLSISGNHVSMVFFINNGLNEPTVTLYGMTIKDADHTSSEEGGGISNYGYLTVTNCTISGNGASNGHGGGVWNQSFAQMTVTNSTISGNGAYYDGGGIRNDGSLTITNSVVSGNAALGGGGISNYRDLFITGSTVSNNTGGGIDNENGTLTVTNSTIAGNGSYFGIINFALGDSLICNPGEVRGGIAHILNSTISGNQDGIGSFANNACQPELDVTNSTIFGNSGYGLNAPDGYTTLRNTIVAGNFNDLGLTIATASHNLIGDAASAGGIQNGVNGNIVGVNPMLGPLQNNGGPTFTHALLSGSPAINAGDNCVLTENGCGFTHPALTADQTGYPRGGSVDIGAYEFRLTTAATVKVSGRVMTSSGRGIRKAIVTMTDATGATRTTRAKPSGAYSFNGITAEQSYVFQATAPGFKFASQFLTVHGDITNLDFIGQ